MSDKKKWGRRYSDNQAYPKDMDTSSLPNLDYSGIRVQVKKPKSDFPDWFPDWLYEELNHKEAHDFLSMIHSAGMSPIEIRKIPDRVYHVTSNADKILAEGFRKGAEMDVSGFGGSGTYVSTTTYENAKNYLDSMRLATEIVNATITPGEYKNRVIALYGREAYDQTRSSADAIAETEDYSRTRHEYMWIAFEKLVFFAPRDAGAIMYMGEPTVLKGRKPEDIEIVEALPDKYIRFRHKYNIFSEENMLPYYTYNEHETEWRVWDASKLTPLRTVD